jgi:hypothetical protein
MVVSTLIHHTEVDSHSSIPSVHMRIDVASAVGQLNVATASMMCLHTSPPAQQRHVDLQLLEP